MNKNQDNVDLNQPVSETSSLNCLKGSRLFEGQTLVFFVFFQLHI